MADVIYEWVGNVAPVAQVNSFEIGQTAPDGDEDFTFIINNKTVTATSTAAGQEESVVDALVSAWNANPYPECADAIATKELNGSSNPYVITFTASVPGRPFKVTEQGNITNFGTVTTLGNTVDNEGPNVWGLPGNYQKLADDGPYELPSIGDEVHIRVNRPSILYGLQENTLSQIKLKRLRIDNVFTGSIGLEKWNSRGYNEYLHQRLLQPADYVDIGQGEGSGSSRLKLMLGDQISVITVYNTGSSRDVDYAALQIDDCGPTSIVTVKAGEVDFFRESYGTGGFITYTQSGGTARVLDNNNTIDMTSVDIVMMNSPRLWWNAPMGGTAGTTVIHGGTATFGDKTVVNANGSMTIDGSANVTYNGGDIQSLTIDDPGASIDFSKNTALSSNPMTVTSTTLTQGTIITGDANVVLNGLIPRGTLTMSYP